MKLPTLKGKLRKPKNAMQRKQLAARDFLRRQQISRSIIPPVPSGRWYQRFNGASYVTIPEVVCDGDYEITGSFRTPDDLGNGIYRIYGQSDSYYCRFVFLANGSVNVRFGGISTGLTSAQGVVVAGTAYNFTVRRVGNKGTLTLNRSEVLSGAVSTDPCEFNSIGRNANTPTHAMTISGLVITGATSAGGDTSINSLEYKLDEPWSENHIAYDSANVVDATNGKKINDVEADYTYE